MAKNEYSEDEFLYIKAYTEEALKNMKIRLIDGRLPKNENEIVLSTTFFDGKENEPKIGDTITLEIGKRMSDGEELIGSPKEDNETFIKSETKTYLVCGKIQRPDFEKSTDNYTSGVTFLNEEKALTVKNVDIGVISKNVKDLYKDTEEVAEKLGLYYENALGNKTYNIKYNEYVLAFKGVNSTNGFNEMLYSVCGILITVIMVGSILVIYNSFAISVSERKKQFGMLASIGATKKQIKKSVIYEGAILGSIGIPIGILAGISGIGITLNIVNELLKPMFESEGVNWSLSLVVSWNAIIVAIILIGLTIYLSVMIPAKRASKASPIETIRGNSEIQIKAKKLKTPKFIRKFFGIEGEMALKNLKRSRKKYRTTVISLMISIILFVSVSGFVDYMYSGFDAMYTDVDYDYSIILYGTNVENEIRQKQEIKTQLENSDNIDKLTISESVYRYTILQEEDLDMDMRKNIHNKKEIEEIFSKDENGYTIAVQIMSLTNKQMKEYLKQFGISSLKDNQGILINYSNMIRSAKIEGNITSLKDKDNLKVNMYEKDNEDGEVKAKEKSFEIAKVTDKMPFGITNMDIPKLILIVNEDVINEENENTYTTNIVFTAKNEQELKEELKQMESKYNGLQLYITNVKENIQSQRNLKMIINIFLYGFIVLISSIGIANIFNTISTNINLRKREFAMLKSIGMTDKGFKKMLNLECFFYGTKALMFGLPIGVIICYFINRGFGNMVEFVFNLPWRSIIISIVSVYLVVFITMIYSTSKIRKENIIDVLRDENI